MGAPKPNYCSKINEQEKTKTKSYMIKVLYENAIGSFLYAMLYIVPDISFTIGTVSQFQSYPRLDQWQAAKRIYTCLRATSEFLLGYCAADHVTC